MQGGFCAGGPGLVQVVCVFSQAVLCKWFREGGFVQVLSVAGGSAQVVFV